MIFQSFLFASAPKRALWYMLRNQDETGSCLVKYAYAYASRKILPYFPPKIRTGIFRVVVLISAMSRILYEFLKILSNSPPQEEGLAHNSWSTCCFQPVQKFCVENTTQSAFSEHECTCARTFWLLGGFTKFSTTFQHSRIFKKFHTAEKSVYRCTHARGGPLMMCSFDSKLLPCQNTSYYSWWDMTCWIWSQLWGQKKFCAE